jgi:hypothetical protein
MFYSFRKTMKKLPGKNWDTHIEEIKPNRKQIIKNYKGKRLTKRKTLTLTKKRFDALKKSVLRLPIIF